MLGKVVPPASEEICASASTFEPNKAYAAKYQHGRKFFPKRQSLRIAKLTFIALSPRKINKGFKIQVEKFQLDKTK